MDGNKPDKPEPVGPKDMTVEAMKLLAELAEKGQLMGLMRLTADIFEKKAAEERGESDPVQPSRRRPAFGIRLPRLDKRRRRISDADRGVILWGLSLVCAFHRAMDGGRRTRIYLVTGRKAPTDAAVLVAVDLLRQSGLTVRLKDRRPDARVISIHL